MSDWLDSLANAFGCQRRQARIAVLISEVKDRSVETPHLISLKRERVAPDDRPDTSPRGVRDHMCRGNLAPCSRPIAIVFDLEVTDLMVRVVKPWQ